MSHDSGIDSPTLALFYLAVGALAMLPECFSLLDFVHIIVKFRSAINVLNRLLGVLIRPTPLPLHYTHHCATYFVVAQHFLHFILITLSILLC